MPCLNEAETVAACVTKALAFLQRAGVRGEVIVADNGSTDGSRELASRAGARVVEVTWRGYGSALAAGIAAARGRYLIMGDADDSYDFLHLDAFVERLRAGDDLVMGNRFLGGIQAGAMPWLNRFLGNPVLTGVGRLFFKSPVGDFHCGLRGFSREAFDRLALCTAGMEFASEMVVKATLLKMRISEVPTTLAPAGRSRAPHLRPWRDGWRHLRFMLLYSPRWLFLYPGIAAMLVGAAVCLWLLPGPRRVGNVTLDVHTMMYAALAILLGFQAVWFALLAKVYAMSQGLLPNDPKAARWTRKLTLEGGLISGLLLLLFGLGATLSAVWEWRSRSFGPLDPSHVFRIIIPGFLALALGTQTVLGSFLLSVLGLQHRRGSDK